MIRKLNRKLQNFLREKRLKIGRVIYDNKKNKSSYKLDKFIENNDIKSILFLRYDGKIGDMVINTLMFREIKKNYPNIKIGVVARKSNATIIENNPNIDKIYIYEKNSKKIDVISREITSVKYDLLVDFSDMIRVNQMKLINKSCAKYNVGIEKDDWKLFDISLSKPNGDYHITEIYKNVLKFLGIENIDDSYDLHFSEDDKVNKLLKKDKKIIVLNPFAASHHRELNENSIRKIINLISKDNFIYVIGEKPNFNKVKDIIKDYDNVEFANLDTITQTVCLISKSNLVITPDTSIVHIASAYAKPTIAIYRQSNDNNSKLWSPNNDKAYQIMAGDDINDFEIEDILGSIEW